MRTKCVNRKRQVIGQDLALWMKNAYKMRFLVYFLVISYRYKLLINALTHTVF